jgi:hypothetical protein
MSNRPFSYDKEARLRGIKRRGEQRYELNNAVANAAKGDAEALVQHLRNSGVEERNLDALQALIKSGKPVNLSLREETKLLLVGTVRHQERMWRRKHKKSLPRGLRNKLIDEAKDFIGEEGRDIQEITTEEIRDVLERGRTPK